MRFFDDFSQCTRNWRRGSAILSLEAKPLEIRPVVFEDCVHLDYVNLSGEAVNPDNFSQFELTIDFQLILDRTEAVQKEAVLAFGKPYEWSSVEDAKLKIRIKEKGQVYVEIKGKRPLKVTHIEKKAHNSFRINIRKTQEILSIETDHLQCNCIQGGLAGYFSVQSVNLTTIIKSFDLQTEKNLSPLSNEAFEEETGRWINEQLCLNDEELRRLDVFCQTRMHKALSPSAFLDISPGLVEPGELVCCSFRYQGSQAPSSDVAVTADYLGYQPENKQIRLDWKKTGDFIWQSEIEIKADRCGNWQIVWQIDGERISRVFSVIKPGYAVCTLWVGCNKPLIDEMIHRYDLPGDYWIGDWWSPFRKPPDVVMDRIKPFARMRHLYGDRLVPFINANWLIQDIPNYNLFLLDEASQKKGLKQAVQLWDILKIGPLEIMGSYTYGHKTSSIAKSLGIKAMNSICTWQNWLDGTDENFWKINHWGAPNAPYFIAEDDFRKTGGGPGIVGFSMGTATSVRNYSIFTMEGCPSLTCPSRRYTSDDAQSANIGRFYDAVDGWLYDAQNQKEPVFFTVALENFGSRTDWESANEQGVDYLVKRANNNNLVFASAADISDYYNRRYTRQPDHVYFQPDIYCGYQHDAKPAYLPDRIEFSTSDFHSLHAMDQVSPKFFWDYTVPWHEPEWDFQSALRDKHGLINPEQACCNLSPRQVDLSDIKIDTEIKKNKQGVDIIVQVDAKTELANLPVTVWKIPLDTGTVTAASCSGGLSYKFVADKYTGNLHVLILLHDVKKGNRRFILSLNGKAKEPVDSYRQINADICGRTIHTLRGRSTYLWRRSKQGKYRLDLLIPKRRSVFGIWNDGKKVVPDKDGILSLVFDETWQHETPLIYGVTTEEITNAVLASHGSDLESDV